MKFHWWDHPFTTISVNRWRGSLLNSPYKDIAKFFALIVKAMGMRILYARNNIVDDGGCHTWQNAYLVHLGGYFWGSLQKKSFITSQQIKSYTTHPTSLILFLFMYWTWQEFFCCHFARWTSKNNMSLIEKINLEIVRILKSSKTLSGPG